MVVVDVDVVVVDNVVVSAVLYSASFLRIVTGEFEWAKLNGRLAVNVSRAPCKSRRLVRTCIQKTRDNSEGGEGNETVGEDAKPAES